MVKIETEDQIKELKYRAGKCEYENVLKSLKIATEDCKKNLTKYIKVKYYQCFQRNLISGSGLSVGVAVSATRWGSSLEIPIASTSFFISSIARLITNEFRFKLEEKFSRLIKWKDFRTLLHDKALMKSLIDGRIEEREGDELKKYKHYLGDHKEIMENTKISFQHVFGDTLGRYFAGTNN